MTTDRTDITGAADAATKPKHLILTADFADSIWIKPKARMINGSDQTPWIAVCGFGFRICVNLRHLRLEFWQLGMHYQKSCSRCTIRRHCDTDWRIEYPCSSVKSVVSVSRTEE
jgi:hypothetical protein